MQICSVEVYALLLTVYSPKFILLSAQDQVSEKELQELSSFMAFVLASRNREMWCLAVSRVTRVNMKNNFVLIKKKIFLHKNGLNSGNARFCAKLATGKHWFAEVRFGAQGSAHFELFTRNTDDSGLPALLLGLCTNTRGTASYSPP